MTPQSAKAKGRNLCKILVKKILDSFPDLTPYDARPTSSGATGVDLQLSTAALERFSYSPECKFHQAMAIYAHWEQCVGNCLPDTDPLLVIKVNNKEPLAVITLDHFFELVKK